MERDQAAIAAGHPEWASLPATKQETRDGSVFRYFTGKPCKHGHVAPRQRCDGKCVVCDREYQRSERYSCWDRTFRAMPYWRAYDAADAARRSAALIRATPPWLTNTMLTEITSLYAKAERATRETGIPHEVDHVVPLRGAHVCGLHVPWNLRVTTRADNRSKSNRHLEALAA